MEPINQICARNFPCQNVQFQTIGKISVQLLLHTHTHKKKENGLVEKKLHWVERKKNGNSSVEMVHNGEPF